MTRTMWGALGVLIGGDGPPPARRTLDALSREGYAQTYVAQACTWASASQGRVRRWRASADGIRAYREWLKTCDKKTC